MTLRMPNLLSFGEIDQKDVEIMLFEVVRDKQVEMVGITAESVRVVGAAAMRSDLHFAPLFSSLFWL